MAIHNVADVFLRFYFLPLLVGARKQIYHHREAYITFVKLLVSLCDTVHDILSTMYSETLSLCPLVLSSFICIQLFMAKYNYFLHMDP